MIVDASVAAMWVMAELESEAARRLIDPKYELAAPDTLVGEFVSALQRGVRQRRFDAADCAKALRTVEVAIDRLIPSRDIALPAFDMSLQLDHHVSDCLYLAAAVATKDVLVTADYRFLATVRTSPWRDHAMELSAIRS